MGQVFQDPASTFIFYFEDQQRAKFSTPGPGDFSERRPQLLPWARFFRYDATFAKKIYFTERCYLQIRADASNLTNHHRSASRH